MDFCWNNRFDGFVWFGRLGDKGFKKIDNTSMQKVGKAQSLADLENKTQP